MTAAPAGRTLFLAALLAAVAGGTVLRLDMLPGQILLDDEWHGLNQVAGASLGEVLTRSDAKDNTSLPLNVYHWALLRTAGWSEAGVRLPAIAAGILSLVLLPLAARRALGDRAALFFAFFLATSPFAIFYSRFSRAYAPILLLGCLAILAGARWLATGDRRQRVAFLGLGVAGAYFHPLAALSLAAPFAAYGYSALGGKARAVVGAAELRKTALIAVAGLAPLGWAMLSATDRLPWGQGEWSAMGLRDAATLLAGTVNIPLVIAFFGLAAFGLRALFTRAPLLARSIVASAALSAILLAVARPFGLGTGVVLLRYSIVLLPLALLAAAAGFDALAGHFEAASRRGADDRGGGPGRVRVSAVPAAFGLFLGLIHGTGPLMWIYSAPNNFTNHSAYQGSYDPPDDSRAMTRHVYPGYSPSREEVPAFYAALASRSGPGAAPGAIVEYPLDITNYNNLFWYYQRIHHREVIAGYCPDGSIVGHRIELPAGESDQPRLGFLDADQILSRVADRSKLHFANLVDVTDPVAVAGTGARYLVLHKFVKALEFHPGGGTGLRDVYYQSVPLLAGRWAQAAGPPVYEDSSIVCFRIGNPDHTPGEENH